MYIHTELGAIGTEAIGEEEELVVVFLGERRYDETGCLLNTESQEVSFT